jgi:hypothetical protein
MSATNQSISATRQQSTINSEAKLIKPSSTLIASISSGFNNLFFSSDMGLLVFLLLGFLVVGLGFVILFEVGVPNIRSQIVNNFVGVGLGIALITLIFQQMGNTVNFFGRKLDMGMIYYLFILMIIMLVFTN